MAILDSLLLALIWADQLAGSTLIVEAYRWPRSGNLRFLLLEFILEDQSRQI